MKKVSLCCNYEVIKDVDQDIDEMAFFPFYRDENREALTWMEGTDQGSLP
jgi:hypothetical protein